MFNNVLLMGAASTAGAGSFTVDYSVRYNSPDSPRLYRTPAVAGNRMTGSISFWYKRSNLGVIQQLFNAGAGDDITFNASDQLTFIDSSGVSYITTQVFRDTTAWGHLLFAWDTTLAAAGDRLRIYHNGVEITAFDTETDPGEGDAFEISNTVRQTIGANESDTEEFAGYFSQFYYVDGQQLTPTVFGEFSSNNVWRPKSFAGGGTGYTGDVVPVMTAATVPSGEVTVTGTYTTYDGYKAFDHQPWAASNAGWINSGTGAAFIAYEFASSKTIIMYTIMNRAAGESPEDWTFEGWDGGAWVVLDTITGENWVSSGETKVYKFSNTTAYIKYQLNVTLVQTHATEYCAVMNLTMHEASSGYSTNGFFLDFADANNFGLDAAGPAISSTTYRYLKCQITDVESTTYMGIGEMEYFVGTTLYPTQTMTSDTLPVPLVASATNGTTIWAAFDDTDSSGGGSNWISTLGTVTGFLKIDLGSGNGIAPTRISITAPATRNRAPLDFTIQGSNNDSDYTVLATYASNTSWTEDETRNWPVSNGNNFADAGLATDQQVVDTPTNNFPTILRNTSIVTMSEGNLQVDSISSVTWHTVVCTPRLPSTGKWCYEVERINNGVSNHGFLGDTNPQKGDWGVQTQYNIYNNGTAYYLGYAESSQQVDGSASSVGGLVAVANGGKLQMLLDQDAGTITYYANGVLQKEWTGNNTMAYVYVMLYGDSYGVPHCRLDFGQDGFTRVDTDYNYICTANFPTPTILDGTKNFQPTLYTGDGSVRNIDQTGNSTFQPDFVWIKNRSAADDHMAIDAARGVTKQINPDGSDVEVTDANGLTSFDSNGFGLGTGAGGYNDDTESFVAWQWKAGGGAGSSNEDGTINTTTTTVNTTAGISVGTYTGTGVAATIGHGLGVVPKMVIAKCRNDGTGAGQGHWYVYHGANTTAPETDYLLLNTNAATVDNATIWNDTAPTSTVFSIGTGIGVNESTNTYIYYAFAEIEGFSKFGLYTGNGNANGPAAYLSFKPSYVMIKKTTGTGGWVIYDSQRSPYNEIDDQLLADTTAAETTGSEEIDFLSNGFKIRTTDSDVNTSSGKYVFAAFAEYPFGGEDVTPATTF